MTIKNRRELLFIYDVKNANPNGDPADENKPRIDEETGLNIVTDVRLKRTVRDQFFNFMGYNGKEDKDIFVRTTDSEKGGIKDGKARARDFGSLKKDMMEDILKKCIDIRLFGGVIPMDKDSIIFTGPVQFKMGKSLHKVQVKYIKGTGAFAGKEGANQQTFREEYILPYSLICFHGIINENAAKETRLTDEDIEELKKAMWEGTKNLISRSKFEHSPQMLIEVKYKEENFFIGELDKYISFDSDLPDEKIRDISDGILNLNELKKIVEFNKDKIESVELKQNNRVKFEGFELSEGLNYRKV
ncbi:MAG: type I-B CRISPR-associated protein Cas7/Csh2 [Desulforegulaceae bacterium]|nr:type I-B CRISPR-associated protein Cas7/Csh2 [Desulforegulaceae bacterium]